MYLIDMFKRRIGMPMAEEILPGRAEPIPTSSHHYVTGQAFAGPFPESAREIFVGMGCFWGAERLFWEMGDGILVTQVGYQGGVTPNPTYQETCTGLTGHTEIVRIVHDPARIPLETLLKVFFEEHDPTQGMRQGNDMGTQYRSALYWTAPEQEAVIRAVSADYGAALAARGKGPITTELAPAGPFYAAEAYHQQYLAKNPDGYCGLKGTGVSCPIPERRA
jgi:peptide-methionine (S)-S-oxide reductase